MNEPNLIKVAIVAGGERVECAKKLGVSLFVLSYWQRSHNVPARYIRALAGVTSGLVTVDALLAYIERSAASLELQVRAKLEDLAA